MEPLSEKPSLKLTIKLPKRENHRADSTSAQHPSSSTNLSEDKAQHPSSSTNLSEDKAQHPSTTNQSECDGTRPADTDDDLCANESNQLVLYDPAVNGSGNTEPPPEPSHAQRTWLQKHSSPNVPHRVLPSVGALTVQCSNCFKWRLIPTVEKYEEIREHILEQPFYCETAREWRPDITCDDPEDISQDGSRVWAIDKPNIAQPPPGWQRQLRIRAEGGCKFADVYYVAPTRKRLRSMVEVQKFLDDHPEYVSNGVTLSRFSFQIPKPLNEEYVKKRPAQKSASRDVPLSIEGPDSSTDLQLGMPALPLPPSTPPSSNLEAPDVDSVGQPVKKRARTDT